MVKKSSERAANPPSARVAPAHSPSPKPEHRPAHAPAASAPAHASHAPASAAPAAKAEPDYDFFKPLRAAIAARRPQDGRLNGALILALVALMLAAFGWLLGTPASALMKFAGSAILFMLGGECVRGLTGWDGFWGLIMFKDRSTLAWIDRQAQRYAPAWSALADLGLVMGYGLLAYFLMGPNARKPARLVMLYAVGLPLLLVFSLFVSPAALGVMTAQVSHNEFGVANDYVRSNIARGPAINVDVGGETVGLNPVALLFQLFALVGGMALSISASLISYATLILPTVLGAVGGMLSSLVSGESSGGSAVPPAGAAPLLPGVNLPLVEGLLALATLLVVHEMSHALLARVHKIRLDSAGVVFFGALPFGAFVDPDEKELDAAEGWKANQVLVAGPSSNLVASLLVFTVFILFVGLTLPYRAEGYAVTSGPLPIGAILYSFNGTPYTGQNMTLAPNSTVALSTSAGEFVRTTDANGKVGITMSYVSAKFGDLRIHYKKGFEWLTPIATTLGLMFALNMLVGVVNLLPIPLFDGHRLMKSLVRHPLLVEGVTWLVAGAFAANFLPWLFK